MMRWIAAWGAWITIQVGWIVTFSSTAAANLPPMPSYDWPDQKLILSRLLLPTNHQLSTNLIAVLLSFYCAIWWTGRFWITDLPKRLWFFDGHCNKYLSSVRMYLVPLKWTVCCNLRMHMDMQKSFRLQYIIWTPEKSCFHAAWIINLNDVDDSVFVCFFCFPLVPSSLF